MSCPAASASTKTALYASRTEASGWLSGIIAGCTRAVTELPSAARSQIARSLTVQPMRRAEAMSAAVTSVMPSRCTSPIFTRVWKAIPARMAAFAAASKPSTSAVGSASA